MDAFGWEPYHQAVAPLVLAHVAISPLDGPPLTSFSLRLSAEAVRKLIFIRSDLKERPWAAVTYMFLHADSHHLTGNCMGLVACGAVVHRRLGAAGLWGFFLLGGVGGVLDPLGLTARQLTHSFRATLAPEWLVGGDTVKEWFPRAADWWVDQATRLGGLVAPSVAARRGCIGSSAGVTALAGAGTAIVLEELLTTTRDLYREYTGYSRRIIVLRHAGDAAVLTVKLVGLLGTHVLTEMAELESGQSWGVSHAGHLSGFACGFCGMAGVLAVSAAQRWGQHPRRR
eukprot:m.271719 g.271719  ORF g.271719 m.271719 type:complete len:285 (+) comp16102_c3_seq1:192-1046(+)